MFIVNCDKFSGNDLVLFIESMEEITRIKNIKKERKKLLRIGNIKEATHHTEYSATKMSSRNPAESFLTEITEEEDHHYNRNWNVDNQRHIVKSTVGTPESIKTMMSNGTLMGSIEDNCLHCNTTFTIDDQYFVAEHAKPYYKEVYDALPYQEVLYKSPYDYQSYIKFDDYDYESVKSFDHEYHELELVPERATSKRKLSFLGYVCKKYKKCFSNSNNYWDKSDSWTKVTPRWKRNRI